MSASHPPHTLPGVVNAPRREIVRMVPPAR